MNKKAFTLIEILGIIIIIGLIAIITIPFISSELETSKKNIAKVAVTNYKKSINELILREELDKNKIKLSGEYNINASGNIYNSSNEYEIEFSGKKPKNGTLTFSNDNITTGCITIDKYKVEIRNDEIIDVTKGTCQYTRLLDRNESLLAYADDYIDEFEETTISTSGIYNVSDINEEITVDNYPINGWIKINYKETGEITIKEYSLDFGDKTVNYSNSTKSLSNSLTEKPELECPDPTCSIIHSRNNVSIETLASSQETRYICNIYNNQKYCLLGNIDESSLEETPVYNKNKAILESLFETCSINTNTYSCDDETQEIYNAIKTNGYIGITKYITDFKIECKTNSDACSIEERGIIIQ